MRTNFTEAERRLLAAHQADLDVAEENAHWSMLARQRLEQEKAGAEARNFAVSARTMRHVLASDGRVPDSIVWMPVGVHQICAGTADGGSWEGTVLCDAQAFADVKASFDFLKANGWLPFIDYQHDNGEAAGWVRDLSWDPARGIIAGIDWTSAGEQAIRDRRYVSFSPTFLVDRVTNRAAGMVRGMAAGGIVNAPAFGNAMPPLLSLNGRAAAAELVREMMTSRGVDGKDARNIATLVEAGMDARALGTLMKLFSGA